MRVKSIMVITVFMLGFILPALSETLFQIKDESGNPVLVVSSDGLRILNGPDTLMVISSSEIKANITEGATKGLSRTFSISTTTSKGSLGNVLNVTTDGLDIVGQSASKLLGDTLMTISSKKINARIPPGAKGLSRTFSVSTTTSKGSDTNVLEVMTDNTVMKEGATGDDYTDFSPENILLGLNAGEAITLGTGNTFMGNNAGKSNTTGNNNVMIGESAGKLWNGSFGNVFIGEGAADSLLSGHRNVMIGYRAGAVMTETEATYGNVFLGAVAGKRVSGNYNVMLGEAAGENYQQGSEGSYNIFIGKEAGQHNTGDNNICIGVEAGTGLYNNPLSGHDNIFIGNGTDPTAISDSYRLAIGTTSYGDLLYGKLDTSKQLVVNGNLTHNENGRTFFVNGSAGGTTAWSNDSDVRDKKNIETIGNSLDKVMKLRGVTYEWNDPEKHEPGRKMGFIAQESKDIIPEAVDYNKENDHYSMQYAPITAILVEAVKDLKKQVDSNVAALETKESENKKIIDGQNEKIGMLINENKELKNKVQELESLRAEIDTIKRQIAGYANK